MTGSGVARTSSGRPPWLGAIGALALIGAAVIVPWAMGWEVRARSEAASAAGTFPPLHGYWEPLLGGSQAASALWEPAFRLPPALVIGFAAARYAVGLAERLPWRRLWWGSYLAGLAWLLALALTDGTSGISHVLGSSHEYLQTARSVSDVPALLAGFVDRIPRAAPDNWPTHIAGHPPGALLFFVALVRVGLGGDLAAGVVVIVIAATVPLGVLTTLRTLGAETAARRAAPFLVFGPAAIFAGVSADAVFAAVGAWGLAALARAATRPAGRARLGWSGLGWARLGWACGAGLLLGSTVLLSYGLLALGLLAIAVLGAARSWRPLIPAVLAACTIPLAFAAYGFAWWEAFPVLRERYWDGIAAERPASYWIWANIAALLIATGPILGAALAALATRARSVPRAVPLLVGAAGLAVLVADVSLLSKAEVERIWLPFMPWLLIATAALSERWRRWGLVAQIGWALALETLFYTSW